MKGKSAQSDKIVYLHILQWFFWMWIKKITISISMDSRYFCPSLISVYFSFLIFVFSTNRNNLLGHFPHFHFIFRFFFTILIKMRYREVHLVPFIYFIYLLFFLTSGKTINEIEQKFIFRLIPLKRVWKETIWWMNLPFVVQQ